MRSTHFEVLVRLPLLATIDRLPSAVTADGVSVTLTGAVSAADVVGSLRAHVAGAEWRRGRRRGTARYEVTRTHSDRCALTLVADGLPMATVQRLADAARAAIGTRAIAAPVPAAAAPHAAVTRPA
jgi:hypothetical protein